MAMNDTKEKGLAYHAEDASPRQTEDGYERHTAPPTWLHKGTAMERKMIRRIDLRLIPVLGFMYACSLIDRTNLPNARVSGMDAALGTNIGNRYTMAVLFFFVPYILTEIPANLVLKAGVPPRLWLPTASLIFGGVMMAHAGAPNWQTLVGLRIPLGAFEGFLFPGSVFLISAWYRREELQKRISAFYLMGASVSGFSNIIAYGFSEMAGLGGLGGWQWIFLMMGLMTVTAAILGYIFVPNFPGKATFLSEEERELCQARIDADRQDFQNDEKLTASAVFRELGTVKHWMMGLLFLCSTLPAYAFSYFLFIFSAIQGFSPAESQLLSAPPYIAAVLIGMIVAYCADRVKMRGPFIIAGAICSAVGQIILGYTTGNGVRYFGSFLAIIGCQSNIPTVMTWSQNNVRGYVARAVASAIVVAGGGVGGIIAGVAFRSQDAPTGYRPGLWTGFAAQMLILVIVSGCMVWFRKQNRLAQTQGKILEGQPGFRYTM